MILLKIGAILGAIGGWNYYLSTNAAAGAEDYLDLIYVVLFIGSVALLELTK